jgi:VCBS repeat-containing protein
MSLVNQQVGSYRLVRKLRANQNYKTFQAIHIRSSEEQIIQLAKLDGKLHKKESRTRLRKKVESLRAINSPHVISILKYDVAKIKGNNYFYLRIPCFLSVSLKEWLQLRAKTKPLSQQDADNIMHQARKAVEVLHKSGIAHLNIELSSFMIEMTEDSHCPRVILNDFLPAVLITGRIRENDVRRKQAITEDQNALREMEKLLNHYVEETVIEPAESSSESPVQILERRLAIAEEEKGQIQRKLRELEEEKERITRELQEQRAEERRRLILAGEEKERIIQDLREQKENDAKLLAEAITVSTGARGAGVTPIAPSGGTTSRRSGRWFWGPGGLLLLTLFFAGTTCLLAGLFIFAEPVRAFFDSSSAKVTITQAAYELPDSYIFTGVTHWISKEKSRSVTVPATNLVLIPSRKAKGILTFRNTQFPCNVARAIPAGTVFTSSQGISMVTDHIAFLGASCSATAPAHAVKIGSVGDIGAHKMKQIYHSTIIVDNPEAFFGGRFAQSYTTVQQSDIDQAARSLAPRLKKETQTVLRMQLQSNEQFVTSPICKSKVTSDHLVNDATTHLTVKVTVTCKVEFYNSQELRSRSEQMLKERAQALFGPNYRLTGEMKAEITHIATDVKHGTLITVVASGLWRYQFNRARADQVAQLIAGKNRRDAHTLLSDQNGAQSVSINISNNENTMPYSANSIHIVYVTTLVPIEEGTISSFIY